MLKSTEPRVVKETCLALKIPNEITGGNTWAP